ARAVAEQQAKVDDSSLTPSARVLEELQRNGESFSQFALRQTRQHAEDFRGRALSDADMAWFDEASRNSLTQQAQVEAADTQDFDSFVEDYQRSLTSLGGA
ncbi:MAG TPA: glutamate--cysteine ligase, partial [Pseudomonas sp.]|nr:glutamate--cysteine ligase [Pseudomonas sp.]